MLFIFTALGAVGCALDEEGGEVEEAPGKELESAWLKSCVHSEVIVLVEGGM